MDYDFNSIDGWVAYSDVQSKTIKRMKAEADALRAEIAHLTTLLARDTDTLMLYRGAYGTDHRNQMLAKALDTQLAENVRDSQATIDRIVESYEYRTLAVDLTDRWSRLQQPEPVTPLDGMTHAEAVEMMTGRKDLLGKGGGE
jgi:hypothetical protein